MFALIIDFGSRCENACNALLVPEGNPCADVTRSIDEVFGLGKESKFNK